jgi:hypothetical protein
MDKLLEMLGVEKLDEAAQTEIKEKLDAIIEIKAKELSEASLKEEKESLVEQYESKFEDYKEEITSKFSNFVDSILDEEMTIPEKVLDFAKKGELYHDLIEQFKVRLSIDENLLDEEVRNLLKEAKDEIVSLRTELDKSTDKTLEMEVDNQKLSSDLYLRQKADGLTETQKKHVFEILGGITDAEEIDRKFDIVVESSNVVTDNDDDKKDLNEDTDVDDDNKGKGAIDSDDQNVDVNEDDKSPFQEYMSTYVKTLKDGKV